jgi:hypothetical protein
MSNPHFIIKSCLLDTCLDMSLLTSHNLRSFAILVAGMAWMSRVLVPRLVCRGNVLRRRSVARLRFVSDTSLVHCVRRSVDGVMAVVLPS